MALHRLLCPYLFLNNNKKAVVIVGTYPLLVDLNRVLEDSTINVVSMMIPNS